MGEAGTRVRQARIFATPAAWHRSHPTVHARTRSLLQSIAAGAALGAVGLVARYAPARSPVAAAPPAPVAEPEPEPTAEPEPAPKAACPDDMTLVDGDFCPKIPYDCVRPTGAVGCAEWSRERPCLEPTDHRRYCIDKHEWPNKVGENPQVWVDFFEAKALCQGAGKRLCRRSEWILACEGPKRLPFPWGFVRQPSPCNVDRQTFDFDIGAMMNERTREGELLRLWQADRIGSHPDCVSAFGAYDLAGNVDEWTDNQLDDPGTQYVSTLNGGYWGPVRNTCRLTTKSHGPTFQFYQVGFRCCSDTGDGVEVPPPKPFIERDWARHELGKMRRD